jgi:hypothetical protein
METALPLGKMNEEVMSFKIIESTSASNNGNEVPDDSETMLRRSLLLCGNGCFILKQMPGSWLTNGRQPTKAVF